MFEDAFADRFQRSNTFLLLLFFASGQGKLASQFVVGTMAVEVMTETHSLIFRSVCKNNAYLCVGVHIKLVVRFGCKFFPTVKIVGCFYGFFVEWIQTHFVSPYFDFFKCIQRRAVLYKLRLLLFVK